VSSAFYLFMGSNSTLKTHHWQAISLLTQGYTNEEVAQALNMTARQVRKWHNWELFREQLEEGQRRIFEAGVMRCNNNVRLAIDALVNVARNSKSPSARVSAADKILSLAQWNSERDVERRLDILEQEVREN